MLQINFLQDNANVMNFALAVGYEKFDMTMSLLRDSIATVTKKIENKNGKYTVEQVEGFKSERTQLESDLTAATDSRNELEATHTTVVSTIALPDAEGHSNDSDAIRNVLRLIAAAENSKLYKYVITSDFENATLFEALEKCHDINDVTAEYGGLKSATKALREAYKTAESEIQSTLRSMFSLPVENEYTGKLRVRFNDSDLKLLHECYITGFSNKMTKADESGNFSFEGRTVKKLISVRGKGDKMTVNYAKFVSTIAQLAVAKIASK